MRKRELYCAFTVERRQAMKKRLMYCFVLTASIVMTGVAAAGDDFGIQTYPGARSDADTREVCAAPSMGIIKEREDISGLTKSKHCYRTNDSFAKVVEFYKKQKGLKGGVIVDMEGTKSASFCLSNSVGCNEVSVGTSVAISAPWFVPSSMKMNNDLLIDITNRAKK
jgi:hypothetical protein